MSRSQPWRSKPSSTVQQLLPFVDNYRLYLVQETGCTSFIFKDENDSRFKVSIGNTISCSCGAPQHCIHILFVMLKKYKVDINSPMIWQLAYLDSQLQGLVNGKYRAQQKKLRIIEKSKDQNQTVNAPTQEDDCPICYQKMVNQCYSGCPTCKNTFHTNCFKIWAEHKETVSCPLCRHPFSNPMQLILQDKRKFQKETEVHRGVTCGECRSRNFKNTLYRCLRCENYIVCANCYVECKHNHTNTFAFKQLNKDQWRTPQGILKDSKITETIMKLLKSVRQEGQQPKQGLRIVGNMFMGLVCMDCNKEGDQHMKRLDCNHYAHVNCLRNRLNNSNFFCQCKVTICGGYLNMKGIQQTKLNDCKRQTMTTQKKNQQKQFAIQFKMQNKQQNRKLSKNIFVKKTREKTVQNKFRIKKSQKKEEPFQQMAIMGRGATSMQSNSFNIRAQSTNSSRKEVPVQNSKQFMSRH